MCHFTCVKGCYECCGVIPVTKTELDRIHDALERKPQEEIKRLGSQQRKPFTCPLVDAENGLCAVHDDRPEICRMYGFYEGMACHHQPTYATGTRKDGGMRLSGDVIGILGLTFTWKNGSLVGKERQT